MEKKAVDSRPTAPSVDDKGKLIELREPLETAVSAAEKADRHAEAIARCNAHPPWLQALLDADTNPLSGQQKRAMDAIPSDTATGERRQTRRKTAGPASSSSGHPTGGHNQCAAYHGRALSSDEDGDGPPKKLTKNERRRARERKMEDGLSHGELLTETPSPKPPLPPYEPPTLFIYGEGGVVRTARTDDATFARRIASDIRSLDLEQILHKDHAEPINRALAEYHSHYTSGLLLQCQAQHRYHQVYMQELVDKVEELEAQVTRLKQSTLEKQPHTQDKPPESSIDPPRDIPLHLRIAFAQQIAANERRYPRTPAPGSSRASSQGSRAQDMLDHEIEEFASHRLMEATQRASEPVPNTDSEEEGNQTEGLPEGLPLTPTAPPDDKPLDETSCWPGEAWVCTEGYPRNGMSGAWVQIQELRPGIVLRPPTQGQRPQTIKNITTYPYVMRTNIILKVGGQWHEVTPAHRFLVKGHHQEEDQADDLGASEIRAGSYIRTGHGWKTIDQKETKRRGGHVFAIELANRTSVEDEEIETWPCSSEPPDTETRGIMSRSGTAGDPPKQEVSKPRSRSQPPDIDMQQVCERKRPTQIAAQMERLESLRAAGFQARTYVLTYRGRTIAGQSIARADLANFLHCENLHDIKLKPEKLVCRQVQEITDTFVAMHYNGILIWTSRIDFFAVAISGLSIFFLERLLKVEAELNWHGKARSEAEYLRRSEK